MRTRMTLDFMYDENMKLCEIGIRRMITDFPEEEQILEVDYKKTCDALLRINEE